MVVSLAQDKRSYTPQELDVLASRVKKGDLSDVLRLYEDDIKVSTGPTTNEPCAWRSGSDVHGDNYFPSFAVASQERHLGLPHSLALDPDSEDQGSSAPVV